MADLIKLTAVFVLIILLLRFKVKIGYVMLGAAAALSGLYLLGPSAIIKTISATSTNPVTAKLIIVLAFIRIMELVLREKDLMSRMMTTAKEMFKSRRAVIITMPLIIGMLPSVGGAYFSAPMVAESTRGLKMPPEEKAFINYWFRHPWEFILPMYPGLLLASAITSIEIRELMILNMPYAITIMAGGFMFSMKNIKKSTTSRKFTLGGLLSFVPITSVLVLVLVIGVELYISIVLITVTMLGYYKYGLRDLKRVLKHGFAIDILLLIFGVMLFKTTMDSTGAVSGLSEFLTQQGIPLMSVLLLLPFMTGLLTGLAIGFVGATFPLLVSLDGGAAFSSISLAYAAGFTGVLLSPTHVCLVLTKEYFKADMGLIYKKMLVPAGMIMVVALSIYLFN